MDVEDHRVLLVEYPVADRFANEAELEKRYRLQDQLDEILGWTGLGHCDGGSSGEGTMEACCFVVDFALAKAVIADALKNTEFEDYSRIFDENAELS